MLPLIFFEDPDFQRIAEKISACRLCPRLVAWREEVALTRRRAYRDQEYWGKPVPAFGDPLAQVLVVGLAPGAHGANRTGRVFTGDSSGQFLFRALHKAGFANSPQSLHIDDGLVLSNIYIAAVCRCAPPDNKPERQEIANCLPFLAEEISLLKNLRVLVALGRIAFDYTLDLYRSQGFSIPKLEFAHGALHHLGPGLPDLIASYHPSRQNTQTGRLTEAMFDTIWAQASSLLPSRNTP